jgi:single-strand DNA-binding protein
MSLNLCVVRGECSAPAEVRLLASGARLASLSVRVRAPGGPATSVPVVVWDPPPRTEDALRNLCEGDEVVAVGRVVRRFFRSGAGTASRVEVRAELVAPADRRRLAQALRRAERALDDLAS